MRPVLFLLGPLLLAGCSRAPATVPKVSVLAALSALEPDPMGCRWVEVDPETGKERALCTLPVGCSSIDVEWSDGGAALAHTRGANAIPRMCSVAGASGVG